MHQRGLSCGWKGKRPGICVRASVCRCVVGEHHVHAWEWCSCGLMIRGSSRVVERTVLGSARAGVSEQVDACSHRAGCAVQAGSEHHAAWQAETGVRGPGEGDMQAAAGNVLVVWVPGSSCVYTTAEPFPVVTQPCSVHWAACRLAHLALSVDTHPGRAGLPKTAEEMLVMTPSGQDAVAVASSWA